MLNWPVDAPSKGQPLPSWKVGSADNDSFFRRALSAYRVCGPRFFFLYGLARIFQQPIHFYYRHLRAPGSFLFREKTYDYFFHGYNTTWLNERAVGVPIFKELMEQAKGKRILEIGDVLSNYGRLGQDILDKYVKAPGVLNKNKGRSILDRFQGKRRKHRPDSHILELG